MPKTMTRAEEIDRQLSGVTMLRRELPIETRAADTDTMTFRGVAVPWDTVIEHYFGRECFARGAFADVDPETKTVPILDAHQRHQPVGRITETTDTETGQEIAAFISDTTRGRDLHTLLRDKVITSLSVGFRPLEWRIEHDDDTDEDTIIFTRCELREVSIVAFPAYEDAKITDVRHSHPQPHTLREETPMTDTLTRADLAPVNDKLQELQRTVEAFDAGHTGTPTPAIDARDMGSFLKLLVRTDETGDLARAAHREYTSDGTDRDAAVQADTIMRPSVIGEFIKFVDRRRHIKNRFQTQALPATGHTVEYVKLKEDGTAVAKQEAELTNLVKGKVTLEPGTAKVETFGGWTELSRQAIERASVSTLNITLRALGLRYAQVTDDHITKVYTDQIAANLQADGQSVTLADPTDLDAWIDVFIDAAVRYHDAGFELQGLDLSPNLFKVLAKLEDSSGQKLLKLHGGAQSVNQTGELKLSRISGELMDVDVDVLLGTSGVASFYDTEALVSLESPGAPAQLQDENIVNLSKAFSVYGYLSAIVPFPQAIVPLNIPGGGQ